MLRLRFLLFWLLVLAIPFQGFAATTRLLCEHAHGQGHAPSAGTGHAHGHADAIDDTSALTMQDDGGDRSSTALHNPEHPCGLCAACCHVVAIAHEYAPVLAAPPPRASVPEAPARVPTPRIRLPEKPPRAA